MVSGTNAVKHEVSSETDSRQRIIAAAEEVFALNGFEGASLRQIGLKAEVPATLVPYYFQNKAGLYRAIFEIRTPTIIEQRRTGLALAALENDPRRKLDLIIKSVISPMLRLRKSEGSSFFGILLAREVSDPRSPERGIIQEMLDPVAHLVITCLGEILKDSSQAQLHWAYQAIIGVMTFVMADSGRIARISDDEANPYDVDRTVGFLADILLNGLGSQIPR